MQFCIFVGKETPPFPNECAEWLRWTWVSGPCNPSGPWLLWIREITRQTNSQLIRWLIWLIYWRSYNHHQTWNQTTKFRVDSKHQPPKKSQNLHLPTRFFLNGRLCRQALLQGLLLQQLLGQRLGARRPGRGPRREVPAAIREATS